MLDAQLLAAVPEFIALGGLMKATPSEEGGQRVLYFEASNEDRDHMGEVVLQKALSDSAEFFLRHGNIDLSHFTLLGPKAGIPNYLEYEIGKPVAAQVDGTRTFVKAHLYQGDSAMARNANMVWDSLTKQTPKAAWYPSVGGAVLSKSLKIDPVTKEKIPVIDKVRWNNVALDRQPVNRTVPEVSMVPVGTFAKSMGGFILKTLTAGYGTDAAALAGGGALREQSLQGVINYQQFRDQLADALRQGRIGKNPGAHDLAAYAAKTFGLDAAEASELVERFMRDLSKHLQRRKT